MIQNNIDFGPLRRGQISCNEDDARGAEREQGIPVLYHADADRACRIVTAAARNRNAVHAPATRDIGAQRSADIAPLAQARHVIAREA
jgi:hypothetical protein